MEEREIRAFEKEDRGCLLAVDEHDKHRVCEIQSKSKEKKKVDEASNPPPRTRSIISDCFGGSIVSRVTCANCGAV